MFLQPHPRLYHRTALMWIGMFILVLTGATVAGAQDLVQPDGRINQVAHFGGDALYCVDLNMIATNDYPVMIADGGLRLLNSEGQLKWFVPAEDILDAIAQSKQTGGGVLVAEGEGSYGPVRLYTYFDGKDQRFVFSGYDEYGKSNSLDFVPCIPVGPIPSDPGDGEELCTLVPLKQQVPDKRIAPVKGEGGMQVPCDTCPNYNLTKLLAFKPMTPVDPISAELYYCLELGSPYRPG